METFSSSEFDSCIRTADVDRSIDELIDALGLDPRPGAGDIASIPAMKIIESQAPQFAVPMVCRLLIRKGDVVSLESALKLSFLIHELERQAGESHGPSTLFKGLCQIGLGRPDLGVKNISRAVSGVEQSSVETLDLMLARWGLISAAIYFRDLSLAARFTSEWRRLAGEGRFANEVARADEAQRIFRAITGDVPLNDHGGKIPADEVPLLLGVDRRAPVEADPEDFSDANFTDLCRLRHRYDSRSSLKDLSREKLASLADFIAGWQLAKPLRNIEDRLRELDSETYFRSFTDRVLGKHVWDKVTNDSLVVSGTERRDDVVVWMTDVWGYSALSEKVEPETLFATLSPLFRIMNEELEEAGGMILEFIGDSILVLFNLFKGRRSSGREILVRTTRCLQRLHSFGSLAQLTGTVETRIGIGINKGSVALGYLGGLRRCHLSTLGSAVNIAARIEGLTRKLPCPVALEASMFDGGEPDVWSQPHDVNFSLRDLGNHQMKNIEKPAHVYGLNPLLRYWIDFVPMGFVAVPQSGVVYLDVGNDCAEGIIDHHSAPGQGRSACAVVNARPELVTQHLEKTPASQIEFRLHQDPDLDCAASLYSACEHLEGQPRQEILGALSKYVSEIDQGYFPRPEHYADSLYGVFLAHQNLTKIRHEKEPSDYLMLEAGLRVIDAALFLAERKEVPTDFARIFQSRPGWFPEEREWLRKDREKYLEDLQRSHTYKAPVAGADEPVAGLWLDHPQSAMFKLWARNDPDAPGGNGYPFLAVDWSTNEKTRFVISTDPGSNLNLKGLGQALEEAESEKRNKLGTPRPTEPKRYPSDNSDPWYFGQGHSYTIVDSPSRGTVLTAEEVKSSHQHWQPPLTRRY